LSFKIGEWCFNTLFYEDTSESMRTPYFTQLKSEQLFWFVEDVIEAAKCSQLFNDNKLLQDVSGHVSRIGDLYGLDEEAYWSEIEGAGRRKLLKMFSKFCENSGSPLSEMRGLYAPEVADRILHDRQLCNFLARTVMNIGFDGETVEGLRAQWVERERWPEGVKALLRARDRGRCAACGVDIVQELRETSQIDHMFPIAGGGCNDVVNLQLLCAKCNRGKRDLTDEASSSVPQYTRRVAKRPGR
jgi:HNH endonuclease